MNVLAIGAHPDDIELGCGATLLGHRRRGDRIGLLVMTAGGNGPQDSRSRSMEQEDAAKLLGAELMWGEFEDGRVPEGKLSVDVIESALERFNPDVVYTHAASDSHQDHRAIAGATLGACRRVARVLMYEGPSTLNFNPSVFVDVRGLVEEKVDVLRAHVSQVLKNCLVDLEAVEAQCRYRGFQARVRWAEAFETERFVWDLATPGPTFTNVLTGSIAVPAGNGHRSNGHPANGNGNGNGQGKRKVKLSSDFISKEVTPQ